MFITKSEVEEAITDT